jgi:hypothetical protein
LLMLGFHQGANLVSLLLGKLRVDSHRCFSFLPERKATMLPQLALHFELVSCTYELNPPPGIMLGFHRLSHWIMRFRLFQAHVPRAR